jgi:dienelactone hydrolase
MALWSSCGGGSSSDGGHAFFGAVVQYESEGVDPVFAEFAAPPGADRAPGILLLHQFNGGRSQWADFAPTLVGEGYAVLAPDLDYRGISRCRPDNTIEGLSQQGECRQLLDDLLRDAKGGIDYLKTRPEVDPETIAVIGASFGANLAFLASGLFNDVDTVVALSPNSNPPTRTLVGEGFDGFAPRSVLFMADEKEGPDSTTLAFGVGPPLDVKIYVAEPAHGGGSAHGVELLKLDETVRDLLAWLKDRLQGE